MLVAQSCLTLYQAPLSMGFSRQGYWSGEPFPPPGDLPDPGIEPVSPALQADSSPLSYQGISTIHNTNSLNPASHRPTLGAWNLVLTVWFGWFGLRREHQACMLFPLPPPSPRSHPCRWRIGSDGEQGIIPLVPPLPYSSYGTACALELCCLLSSGLPSISTEMRSGRTPAFLDCKYHRSHLHWDAWRADPCLPGL